jgi:hypothetical protein
MASAWIERRDAASGTRYVVKYRLGGRESARRYAGSFSTRREALARCRWVAGELAAMRVPHVGQLEASMTMAPTLAEVAERWRTSRVDVAEATAVGYRVQLKRVLPVLGSRRVDEIVPADVAELVTTMHAEGRKRETIRKSLTVLAQVLDFAGVKDNPARDRVHVRLPREEREEPTPPVAGQIEAALPLMPRVYPLAVLVLDATGMRIGELEEKACSAATSMSRTTAGASVVPSRRDAAGVGSGCPRNYSQPSSRHSRHARTALRIDPYSPDSHRSACGQRSREPARHRERQPGRRTISATGGSVSGIARAKRGR